MPFKDKVLAKAKGFMQEEDGFMVFEKFGLTQGAVLLALGVVGVVVFVMNDFWGGVGTRYFGEEGGIDSITPGTAGASGWDTPSSGWN